MTTENIFNTLLGVDVSKHVEKKGQYSYLSWPWAVAELRKVDPKASWEVKHFPQSDEIYVPYMKTDCGYFVEVEVTVNDVKLSQIHPVLDNHNKVIESPNAFDINTSIQRCLVKAIALHGLGLSIYAGEDLPTNKPEDPTFDEVRLKIREAKAIKHLSNIWAKYKGLFDGEDLAGLIMAKDERKVELTEGGKK